MKIIGASIGMIIPKTDYNQTDSSSPDYLMGRDTLNNHINELRKASENAQKTAENSLPKAGGAMTGAVTFSGIVLKEGVDYGDTLPETVIPGKLFFLREV